MFYNLKVLNYIFIILLNFNELSLKTYVAVRLVVLHGLATIDGNNWQFPQDTLNWFDVQNLVPAVELRYNL